MLVDRVQAFALSLPHVTVVAQWGGLVYKVAGKMFLHLTLDGQLLDGIVFKCTPEEFDELTQHDGIVQAPYCAKRMWAKVEDFAALPEAQLHACIRRSYELVGANLPKKTRLQLGLLAADVALAKPRDADVRRRQKGRAKSAVSAGASPKRRRRATRR